MTVNFTVAASVSFIVAARSFIVNVNVTDDVFSFASIDESYCHTKRTSLVNLS